MQRPVSLAPCQEDYKSTLYILDIHQYYFLYAKSFFSPFKVV